MSTETKKLRTHFVMQSNWRRLPFTAAIFFFVMWQLPHRWAGRQADAWFDNDPALIQGLSRHVENWVDQEIELASFNTGSERYDGEWLFGTYLMAGFGFCQEAKLFPERAEELHPKVERCIARILTDQVKIFDTAAWRNDPIETLDSEVHHHAAYLGYLNLLMSVYSQQQPENPYAALNQQITESLARRVAGSDIGLLQTYPGEVYPVDNCAVIAGIAVYEQNHPGAYAELIAEWKATFREKYIDAASGLVIQAVNVRNGSPGDAPRGSGTSLGLYFLSFMNDPLAGELFASMQDEMTGHFLGFGGMREYARGTSGHGDIDSGPVVFGFSMSATGFSLAGCRIFDDRERFRDLFATLHLCGAPLKRDGRVEFVSGGPLGNAIVFAMLTAQSREEGTP